MISGLDVSNVNGHVDLSSLKNQHGLEFVFLKATEGTGFKDPLFPAFWAAAEALGLARGAYHFAHPAQSAQQQADAFLACVRAHGLGDADMVALDLEETDGRTPSEVAGWGREFCSALHVAAGRPVIAYTFLTFAQAGNCAGLGGCPLWIADWNGKPGRPSVPAPWKRWAVHQYSSDGIDLDIADYAGKAAMTAALGVPARPAPKPKPAPEGWTAAMIKDLPVLKQGDQDRPGQFWHVRRLQALLGVAGTAKGISEAAGIAVDGDFGARTATATRAIQAAYGLPVTGTSTPAVWSVLLTGNAG